MHTVVFNVRSTKDSHYSYYQTNVTTCAEQHFSVELHTYVCIIELHTYVCIISTRVETGLSQSGYIGSCTYIRKYYKLEFWACTCDLRTNQKPFDPILSGLT